MGDMIKTGELDAKHFLIAIVAIVALAFVMVFLSGGFNGLAHNSVEGAAYNAFEDNKLIVIDWACFKECTDMEVNTDICKETCSVNP